MKKFPTELKETGKMSFISLTEEETAKINAEMAEVNKVIRKNQLEAMKAAEEIGIIR